MLVSLEVFNALLFRINLAPMVFCFVLNTVFSESYPRPSGEVLSNQLRGLVFGLLLAVLAWTGSAPGGAG
jgi:hypothetical protein